MPAPLPYMDEIGQIDFNDALARLQGLIGLQVKATVNFYNQFFGCGLQGELDRIETLPPDHEAIAVVVDGQTGFYLDPGDTQVYIGPETDETGWLEFRTAFGVSVVIEESEEDHPIAIEGPGP